MLPQSFEAWRHCITVDCGIALTPAFAKTRLTVYLNPDHPETKDFARRYGEQHLRNIISWLQQV